MSNTSPSSSSEHIRLSMRVMINKHNTKVLFALVDHGFADVLLSFLTLPLGVILRLLKHHHHDSNSDQPIIGSLNSLQTGISNLDTSHFHAESGKLMLLNTRNSLDAECRKLKINVDDTQPIKYFTCEDFECGNCRSSVRIYHGGVERCGCGKWIDRQLEVRDFGEEGEGEGEVFTVKTVAFLVGDGLRLVPNVAGSVVRSLEELGVDVAEMDGAEERIVTVGVKEIMELFKGSLLSKTPLTDLILHQKQMHPCSPTPPKSKKFTSSSENSENDTSNAKKIIVKIMLQKSTKKLLFAQSEEDFIDFLFSFLTIPLGQVESLLDSNSSIGSIDNLYKSLQNLNADKYMKNKYTKDRLLKPELAPKFLSENQIFALAGKDCQSLYYRRKTDEDVDYLTTNYIRWSDVKLKDPKGGESYVKGPGMFMITDDLTVTPLCMFSSLSGLKALNISVSDVEELEVEIGLKEGSSILKASLNSTAALTYGLGPFLKKGLKEEYRHTIIV